MNVKLKEILNELVNNLFDASCRQKVGESLGTLSGRAFQAANWDNDSPEFSEFERRFFKQIPESCGIPAQDAGKKEDIPAIPAGAANDLRIIHAYCKLLAGFIEEFGALEKLKEKEEKPVKKAEEGWQTTTLEPGEEKSLSNKNAATTFKNPSGKRVEVTLTPGGTLLGFDPDTKEKVALTVVSYESIIQHAGG